MEQVLEWKQQQEAADWLRRAVDGQSLSHALILTGGQRDEALHFAAAAYLCTAAAGRPCGVCQDCRKTLGDIHPDVTLVADADHKIIPVDTLRALRSDAFIRPNEGSRKVYLFADCAQLDERCQNLLLKLVEEGPPYAAFVFWTENSAALLPTLRSRCVELKLRPQGEPAADNAAAEELCLRLAEGKPAALTAQLVKLETGKLKREELSALLAAAEELLSQALLRHYGSAPRGENQDLITKLTKNLTKAQLMHTIEVLRRYRGECEWNVGAGHVLGALAVELEGIL